MREDFYNLIETGQIIVQYFEEDVMNEPRLSISIPNDDLESSFTDDMFEDLIDYVQECLVVASFAGFEAPTKFYQQIKAFVEEGDPIAKAKREKD